MIKKLNLLILKLCNPSTFIFLSFITALIAINIYNYQTEVFNESVIIIICLAFTYLLLRVTQKKINLSKCTDGIKLKSLFWQLYSWFIILVELSEFVFYGVPLFSVLKISRGVSYAAFGFPLLHHIAVESWVFIFIKHKLKELDVFFLLYAFIYPFLIVNRNLMLFTFFCLCIHVILNNKKTFLPIFIFILALFLFIGIGNLRSGKIKTDIIPFKYEWLKDSKFLWIILYSSSSWFNFFNNIISKSHNLNVYYLNVFPEVFDIYVKNGLLGFMLFYVTIFILIFLVCSKMQISNELKVLFLWMLYHSCMTLFARVFFTTHFIYMLIIFLTNYLLFKNKLLVYNIT